MSMVFIFIQSEVLHGDLMLTTGFYLLLFIAPLELWISHLQTQGMQYKHQFLILLIWNIYRLVMLKKYLQLSFSSRSEA